VFFNFFLSPSTTWEICRQVGRIEEVERVTHTARSLAERSTYRVRAERRATTKCPPDAVSLYHVVSGTTAWTTAKLNSMFYHLLYIHLFRPFLKYNPSTSPLPTHVSPRKLCTHAASLISKLMRLYKRTYGLRQICNIAVYMVHSACTIHLLNLPEKTAKRDIVHGVKHLEEIAEDWLCARRTLSILSVLARKWKIELPEEASTVLARTDAKYGTFSTADVPSPKADVTTTPSSSVSASSPHLLQVHSPQKPQNQYYVPQESKYINTTASMGNSGPLPGGLTNTTTIPDHSQAVVTSIASPMTNGTRNLPPENAMQLPTPYVQQHYMMPDSGTNAVSQQQSSSSLTSASQSPSMVFGGAEALVESHHWWLKDQTSLAVGFDNWESMDALDANGMTGIGNNFFMPGNGSGNLSGTGFGDDEWYAWEVYQRDGWEMMMDLQFCKNFTPSYSGKSRVVTRDDCVQRWTCSSNYHVDW